jgi:serine/threonine protein kinase
MTSAVASDVQMRQATEDITISSAPLTTTKWFSHYRSVVEGWIQDFHKDSKHYSTEYVQTVMNMLDDFMSKTFVHQTNVQGVACACMVVASVMRENMFISSEDLRYACDGCYSTHQIEATTRMYINSYIRPNFNPELGKRLGDRLGHGNSSVFACQFDDDVEDRTFAMKIFEHEDDTTTLGFMQEARALTLVSEHKNCSRFYGAWTERGSSMVLYELYPTGFYDYFTTQGDLPSIKRALRELITAVKYAHEECNLVHRDIKPENIRFDSESTLRLCDWDSSIVVPENSVLTTNPMCTVPFRSPEMFHKNDYNGFTLDRWSIGAVFASMVLIKPLFDGEDQPSVLAFIVKYIGTDVDYLRPIYGKRRPKPLPSIIYSTIGVAGVDLLFAFLQLDPANRISLEDALKHPFLLS